MRILISFCWPQACPRGIEGTQQNLASLPSLTKTMLNKIILTIIKENQMAGLLCSEKVFLACLNSTVETSMISISCQQIFKRLKYVFNPSNSPIVRTVDRMYDEFRRKQEALTRSSVMLSNASVLDIIISGSQAHPPSPERSIVRFWPPWSVTSVPTDIQNFYCLLCKWSR